MKEECQKYLNLLNYRIEFKHIKNREHMNNENVCLTKETVQKTREIPESTGERWNKYRE